MLARILGPYSNTVYTILRVLVGLLFAFHGMQKIFGVLSPHAVELWSQIWWGGLIELVTGLAVAVGFWTTCAAFLASGTMAVAYIQFHWKFAFDSKFFPGVNQGELALVYAFLFLYIACRGGGRWNCDKP